MVYRNYNGGEVKHPKTDVAVQPRVPFGLADDPKDGDRRQPFIAWLASAENPLFAKSMVNRVWSYFTGRGIIEPVDDIRAGNPPSNPALLDALTSSFVESGFDLRALMKTICASRAYQASIKTNRWNEDDNINFSHAQPRRLTAEQMLDALPVATGKRPPLPGVPVSLRAAQIPNGLIPGDDFLKLFGRPKRQSACECERTDNISLAHAMNLSNGNTVSQAVNAPDNGITRIVKEQPDDAEVIEHIYLASIGFRPRKNVN